MSIHNGIYVISRVTLLIVEASLVSLIFDNLRPVYFVQERNSIAISQNASFFSNICSSNCTYCLKFTFLINLSNYVQIHILSAFLS